MAGLLEKNKHWSSGVDFDTAKGLKKADTTENFHGYTYCTYYLNPAVVLFNPVIPHLRNLFRNKPDKEDKHGDGKQENHHIGQPSRCYIGVRIVQ